jgi:Ca2+/Na+ antiporter
MINIKTLRSKILLLTVTGIFSSVFVAFNVTINKIEKNAMQAAIVASAKYVKKTITLKAKHKKEIAQLKLKHKKDIAKVKLKQRSKARIQRVVAVIPVVGVASLAVFEKLEFDDWKTDHPNGTFSEYSDEIAQTVNELLVEEYQEYGKYYQDFWN